MNKIQEKIEAGMDDIVANLGKDNDGNPLFELGKSGGGYSNSYFTYLQSKRLFKTLAVFNFSFQCGYMTVKFSVGKNENAKEDYYVDYDYPKNGGCITVPEFLERFRTFCRKQIK